MSVSLNVLISDRFYKKLDGEIYRKAEQDTVRDSTEEANDLCMDECPVRTGFLKSQHYAIISGDIGRVVNYADYAPDVIYGTVNQSANNYPQRALNNLNGKYADMFMSNLNQYGVLD